MDEEMQDIVKLSDTLTSSFIEKFIHVEVSSPQFQALQDESKLYDLRLDVGINKSFAPKIALWRDKHLKRVGRLENQLKEEEEERVQQRKDTDEVYKIAYEDTETFRSQVKEQLKVEGVSEPAGKAYYLLRGLIQSKIQG